MVFFGGDGEAMNKLISTNHFNLILAKAGLYLRHLLYAIWKEIIKYLT